MSHEKTSKNIFFFHKQLLLGYFTRWIEIVTREKLKNVEKKKLIHYQIE